jgi:predicted nucleic acid-binding protein
MRPRVYLETTIPSYLTAWPSRDVVRLGHQQATRDWWAQRGEYDLFTSRLVLVECQAGDPTAAAERMKVLEGVPLLEQTAEVEVLAGALATNLQLPPRVAADALHIATAASHGLQFLLTWNCTHIANATFRMPIERTCRAFGYEPPVICTPIELLPNLLSKEE